MVWSDRPCVVWTGATRRGYGTRKVGGRVVYVHRLAWEEANGPIPPGMDVLHRCDNPPCRELTHLFLGTATDNLWDASRKGRLLRKLSNDDADEIRRRYAQGARQTAIAAEFGISQQLVSDVVRDRLHRKEV